MGYGYITKIQISHLLVGRLKKYHKSIQIKWTKVNDKFGGGGGYCQLVIDFGRPKVSWGGGGGWFVLYD